ncbi:hypothetical protein PCE1_002922 [Barthelona sp. PCE]
MTEMDPKTTNEAKIDDDKEFNELQTRFEEFLEVLGGDRALEKFKDEFQNLYTAYMRSRQNEKRLALQVKELNANIVQKAADIERLNSSFMDEQQFVSQLNRQIERAHTQIEEFESKENMAQQTILLLKKEIQNLSSLVQQDFSVDLGEESSLKQVLSEKADLIKERDGQLKEIFNLHEEISNLKTNLKSKETTELELQTRLHCIQQELTIQKQEEMRQKKRTERLNMELKTLTDDLETVKSTVVEKEEETRYLKNTRSELQQKLKKEVNKIETEKRRISDLQEEITKYESNLNQERHRTQELQNSNDDLKADLANQLQEIRSLEEQKSQVIRSKAKVENELRIMRSKKDEAEKRAESYTRQIGNLENDIGDHVNVQKHLKKNIGKLERQLQTLENDFTKQRNRNESEEEARTLLMAEITNLEKDLVSSKQETETLRVQLSRADRQIKESQSERSKLVNRSLELKEELKLKLLAEDELGKRITELENRLRQQQNLYESVRGDRNLYSKQLVESHDEILELRRKFKLLSHQILQLKEEIELKDSLLVKSNFTKIRLSKQKESLKIEVQKLKKQIKKSDLLIQSQDAELTKLLRIINESDQDRLKQIKLYKEILLERDILGSQLIRRNDELALLYEKAKIYHSLLKKGEVAYKQRCKELSLLKLKLREVLREKKLIESKLKEEGSLKRRIYRLEKELLKEKNKTRALAEELEKPVNIHRWRSLQGSNPEIFVLLKKLNMLQKRLIKKSQECLNKELLLEEKEKLFLAFKKVLSRQIGPEVSEQLLIYKQNLQKKQKQIKLLAAELNSASLDVRTHKSEIERLNRELNDLKSRYFAMKRRQLQNQSSSSSNREKIKNYVAPDTPPRYGGGFNLGAGIRKSQ